MGQRGQDESSAESAERFVGVDAVAGFPNQFPGRLQAALERKPVVVPPADFARRVAREAARRAQPRESRMRPYGQTVALVATLLAMVALFALAPRATASFSNLIFDLELVILLQLGVLAWWLVMRPNHGR